MQMMTYILLHFVKNIRQNFVSWKSTKFRKICAIYVTSEVKVVKLKWRYNH